jgi:hypothetical protein
MGHLYTVHPKGSVNGSRKKEKMQTNKLYWFLKLSSSFTTHCWQRSSKLLDSVRKGLFRSRSQNPVKTPVFVEKVHKWYQET